MTEKQPYFEFYDATGKLVVEKLPVSDKATKFALGGLKDSQGMKKAPWHLLPFDAINGIVEVLWYGAKKYAPRNWEKGMAYSDVFGATMRHLTDWWHKTDKGKGPGRDADTGYSDLWHAGCNILFLIAYERRGVGHDDRP